MASSERYYSVANIPVNQDFDVCIFEFWVKSGFKIIEQNASPI